jgi:hypothetical protein
VRIGGRVRELEKRRRLMQEPMPADHDRSSTRALNRGNTGIGSDRKMNLAHSNTANLLTPAAVARKQTEAVITGPGEGIGTLTFPEQRLPHGRSVNAGT